MPKWTVAGYLTVSAVATVEADTEEEAREKALELDPPFVCHQCWGPSSRGGWSFNGYDDVPQDAVMQVELEDSGG